MTISYSDTHVTINPPLPNSEIELPENTSDVGTKTNPKVPPPTAAFSFTDTVLQPSGAGMGFFMPPNMSEVFYKESYEDFIEVKEPVELRSFCWTPRQSLYVGCAGGQLLSVDFDTGSTTVLVNPQPLMKVTKFN